VPAGLFDKRVILVLGKGGVGRSTVTAAIGKALARGGRRTLIFQANAKDRLARLMGVPAIGEQIVPIGDKLWGLNTNPAAALHEYGLMVLRYETVYRLVMENAVAKRLVRAIPGLDDYAVVGKLWWHTTEMDGDRPRWDTIVFDAPATGHALTMFKIPRAILEAVPQGPLTRDAVKVRELLEDPARTSAVVVTLAEEMPTNEAVELATRVDQELGIHVSHLVVNQLYPDRFFGGGMPSRVLDALISDGGGGRDDAELAPLVAIARTARSRRQLNERYLARLQAEVKAPQARLPMLFTPEVGPAEVDALSATLEQQLGGQA
jgi:anion-transporting  ArsA/GET3 family ATPase